MQFKRNHRPVTIHRNHRRCKFFHGIKDIQSHCKNKLIFYLPFKCIRKNTLVRKQMLNFVNHHRADPSASRSHQHFTTPNCCSLNNASNLDNNGQRHHILCRRMFLGHRTLLQKCTRSHRHRSRICQQQRTAALIPAGMHPVLHTPLKQSRSHIIRNVSRSPISYSSSS